ncbi:MAG: IPT/TIG domain-containing protein [Verrucomicrobia bacterium]|nr:IPT/TIG domain-containing protein [Verrucomicrobiota bacterium]
MDPSATITQRSQASPRVWSEARTCANPFAAILLVHLLCATALAFGAALPTIRSFSPTSGAPGASVTIDGANFNRVVEVRFNTDTALFTPVSASRVTATVPLGATTGPISVTTALGTAVTSVHFRVPPRITSFTPTNGAPGSTVILEGENFTGANAVRFNGTNASAFVVTAQNQIHATVPNGATSGFITVTTPVGTGATTNHFVVTGTEPIITDFSPTNGVAGTLVIIEGRYFTGATAVKFNGVNAAGFFVTAPTQISATVPAGATTGPITISRLSETGASPKAFVVTTAPVVTDFSPVAGPPGTTVVIEGANFLGATAVKFNGVAAASFSAPAPTQVSAVVPLGAVTGPISVVTPKGAGTSLKPFVVTTSPVITEFAPTNGPPGTVVTIDGVNFGGLVAVKFGGVAANVSAMVSPTQIRSTVPGGAITGPVSVTTVQGTGVSTNQFVVVGEKPLVTGFSPAVGSPGTTILLQGLNFLGVTSVKFNSLNANFAVPAPTQITCTVPPGATTGLLSVTTSAGTAFSTDAFIVAPIVTTFFPTNGVPDTPVIVRGTNFTQVLAVRFNGGAAAFTNSSPNEITAWVPVDATTGSISVTTPAGIVASTNAFVLLPEITSPVRLSIKPIAGQQVLLSWPAAGWRFQVQSSDRIAGSNWLPLTNRTSVIGNQRQLALGRTNQNRFFRLFRPTVLQ